MTLKRKRRCLGIVFLSIGLCGCSPDSSNEAQGYIEGRYTYMATPVSGVLKEWAVMRGTRVKQGQLLFVLEEQPESDLYDAALQNLKQSTASRDAIAANLTYAKIMYERYKILVPKNAIQQSMLDSAKSTYVATIAQLAQANANIAYNSATLAQASWTLNQKKVYAPVDAIVFDTYYRLGEYTIANQSVLSLLAPADIKAIFYISEADLGSIQLGDKVSVQCDSCEKLYFGRISFISPSAEYTPPVIFSTETNEKLIYRIEAEFKPTDAYHLHPGQPVTVTYKIHDRK
jgi:HlyD family secretion protein